MTVSTVVFVATLLLKVVVISVILVAKYVSVLLPTVRAVKWVIGY